MPATRTKGGPTRIRPFRFTDAEVEEIDAIGRTMAEPGVSVPRITVLRAALREFKAAREFTPTPDAKGKP